MKNAEEIVTAYFGGSRADVGPEPFDELLDLIRNIQLDAIKHGMELAADITGQHWSFTHDTEPSYVEMALTEAILKAAKDKTTL